MAIDPKEKQGKKSPLLGRDLDDVMATTNAEKAKIRRVELLSQKEDGPAGAQRRNVGDDDNLTKDERVAKKRKKRESFAKQVMKQTQEWLNEQTAQWLSDSLGDFIDQTQREIDALKKDINQLDNDIKALEERQNKLLERQDAIDKALDDVESGKGIELGPNGKPKNPALRKFFEEYEKRTGQKPDYNDPSALLIILQQGKAETDTELEKTRWDIEEKTKERDGKKREKSELEKLEGKAKEIKDFVEEGKLKEAAELVNNASPKLKEHLLNDPGCPEELKKEIRAQNAQDNVVKDNLDKPEASPKEQPTDSTVVAVQDLKALQSTPSSFAGSLGGSFGGVLQNSLNIKETFQAAVVPPENTGGSPDQKQDLAANTLKTDGSSNTYS